MDARRWARLKEIFHGALERSAEEQPAFLARMCGHDDALRVQVEGLLTAHRQAGAFIEPSVGDPAGLTGRRIGRYDVARLLGVGGMGEVYLARDTVLGRDVALKVDRVADDEGRLLREAQHASRLNHPHICTVHEVGTFEGRCYIVMEYVDGQRLSDLVPPGGLPVERVLRFGSQVADALAHAHAHGIVHRDVKSANVIVTPDDRAKVLDFGLARRVSVEQLNALTRSQTPVTAEGFVAGTLSYMAPEVLRGEQADARSDIWALGVLLYEMTTGTRPFDGATGYEVSAAILHEPPRPMPRQVPAPLQQLVLRCLEKDPEARWRRASEIHAALLTLRVEARPSGWAWSRWGAGRTRPRTATARVGWLVGLIALIGAVVFWRAWDRSSARVAVGPSGRPVLAVLPFDHLAGSPDTAWLSKGVQSMLLTGLAQTRGLVLVSTERLLEVTRATGGPALQSLDRLQALEVARRAGAGATVVGSIVQAGTVVRLDAQVQDVSSGRVLVATSASGTDVFAVVDELAARVRDSVGLPDAGGTRPTAAVSSASPEAFRLYSQGVEAYDHLRLDDARASLQSAVAIDPAFAEAYLQLALLSGPAGQPAERRAYLLKANEHRDRLSEPRQLLMAAELARDQGRYRDAARALDALQAAFPDVDAVSTMAIQLYSPVVGPLPDEDKLLQMTGDAVAANPSSPLARNNHAYALLYAARFPEAIRELEVAARLAPREPNPYDSLGEAYLVAGTTEQALDAYSRALTIDPTFLRGGRAWTLAILGRFDDALRDGGSPPYLTAMMLARVGRLREARETLAAAMPIAEAGGDPARLGALHLVSALIAVERSEYARALDGCRAAEQSVLMAPEDRRRFTLALAHLVCAVAELRSGRPEAARAHLESQRRLYQAVARTDAWWQDMLVGEIALAAGDVDRAEAAFSRGGPTRRRFFSRLAEGSVLSNDLVFRDGRARVAKARGDLRGAIDVYQRLLTYGPDSKWVALFEPRYVLEMARLHARLGDGPAARREYERFLQFWRRADAEAPELAEARRALTGIARSAEAIR